MTVLYVVLSVPKAISISRPWILSRWKKSIGVGSITSRCSGNEQRPDSRERRKSSLLSEPMMKNYELNLLAFYAAAVSLLNFILLAVSLYRLIYLLIRCSSIFFNFSPDIIYAYPFVFLNPLELKAPPAKERIVFLFILIQFIVHKPKTCQSISLQR